MGNERFYKGSYVQNDNYPFVTIMETGTQRGMIIAYPGTLLKVGSRGNSVLVMQQFLNKVADRYASLPRISEDGIFGPATQNAVTAFQKQFGLSPDGIIGPITWNKVFEIYNSAEDTGKPVYPGYLLKKGEIGDEVLAVQQLLNKISGKYSSIPKLAEDGIFGSGTEGSVIAFQRQFGLSPDGIVGPLTWNKIIEIANSISGDNGNNGNNGSNGNNGNGNNPGSGTDGLTADETEVFNLINQQRVNNGLSPLKVDPAVQNVARIKAHDMVDNNYFSHTSPTYGSPFDMLKRFGISYRAAGENIAGNSRNSAAVTGWMNSAGHRANILNNNFNYTGIGVVSDPRYGKIYVQMFLGK